jgi:hypothetical protein
VRAAPLPVSHTVAIRWPDGLRNRQFFGISPVFSIIGPLFCSVFLVIYSNTMVLYIASIVIATVGAGG